jgi:serine/threonine-protein kinase
MIAFTRVSSLSLFCDQRRARLGEVSRTTGFGEYLTCVVETSASNLGVSGQTRIGHFADSQMPGDTSHSTPELMAGRCLGPYRLLRRLGRGAQGDVWKALQLKPTVEMVALKILNANLRSNPSRLAQFRREAERGSKLIGPSLLPVYEMGEADGHLFMAMPYVEGTTLKEVIKARRRRQQGDEPYLLHRLISYDEPTYFRHSLRILAKAVRALADIHDCRVVHRDVKPANILLDLNRLDGVYLCDLGLGRDLDVATPEQMRDGAGTPMYMAPERLRRETADEVRCDIYSMGITLFEALTLARPFQIPDHISWPALAGFLATTTPMRPSQVHPEFPQELEAIIVRAIARNPLDRYRSAREMADDLSRFQTRWSLQQRRRPVDRAHPPHGSRRPHFAPVEPRA